MTFNIVTNYNIIQQIKLKSKYFKVNLGQSLTVESVSGERERNTKDQFNFVYNRHYSRMALKHGFIGDVNFYNDSLIKENVLQLYIDNEEFFIPWDTKTIMEMGFDAWLGKILKENTEKFEEMRANQKEEIIEEKKGDSRKVLLSPGSVTYDDMKAYLEAQMKERLKSFSKN